jgi:hypothetical protein
LKGIPINRQIAAPGFASKTVHPASIAATI